MSGQSDAYAVVHRAVDNGRHDGGSWLEYVNWIGVGCLIDWLIGVCGVWKLFKSIEEVMRVRRDRALL